MIVFLQFMYALIAPSCVDGCSVLHLRLLMFCMKCVFG
jgi:hypothetical protein